MAATLARCYADLLDNRSHPEALDTHQQRELEAVLAALELCQKTGQEDGSGAGLADSLLAPTTPSDIRDLYAQIGSSALAAGAHRDNQA